MPRPDSCPKVALQTDIALLFSMYLTLRVIGILKFAAVF